MDFTSLVIPAKNSGQGKMPQRQERALNYLEERGRITNWEYINLCQVGYRTAQRDLCDLTERGMLKVYKMGRSTYYTLRSA
jgi:ATP-dependent DNA helicase RecG